MTKLSKSTYPKNHTADDFECFGPVASKDTDFANCKLAELGCFKQADVDSNKYYFAAVTKSKKTSEWFLFSEWGRTGASTHPQFQFVAFADEAAAQKEFVKLCDSKNTKRGVWEQLGSRERFVPKTKKDGSTEDLYAVRYMASRTVGLPSGRSICNDGATPVAAPEPKKGKKAAVKKASVHPATAQLMRDLLGGTVTYTQRSMVGGTLPALSAIEEARELLDDALLRLQKVGGNVKNQVADNELKRLTFAIYSMIPKAKPPGAPETDWILSQENIGHWQHDLDAFESALKTTKVEDKPKPDVDVLQGLPIQMEYVDLTSDLGKWLVNWWTPLKGTTFTERNIRFHNIWRIERPNDLSLFDKSVDTIAAEVKGQPIERPLRVERQKDRPDISDADRDRYQKSNTALLFHGTRTVNVTGILRENFRFPSELRASSVTINGKMLGNGSYNADVWTKSSNYCSSPTSIYAGVGGGVSGRHSFMFACDTILGVPYVAKEGAGFAGPPKGHHCVFGKQGHTKSNPIYGSNHLLNNEWVVYHSGRMMMRYLAEVSW